MLTKAEIRVRGVVQGVGFRPFVYKLATSHSLTGSVLNDGDGVAIKLFGSKKKIAAFLKELRAKKPPLARIDTVEIKYKESKNAPKSFQIIESHAAQSKQTSLPPDISICADCEKELSQPKNRRYLYPFINCTNCGQRYTMMHSLPYDRANSSMAKFQMCTECKAEYKNPSDRRFHAEPIGCPKCGVRLFFLGANGEQLVLDEKAIIKRAAKELKNGHIVAVKGVGGFHLICDATNEKAVKILRERKKREFKPLAVMMPDIMAAKEVAKLSKKEEQQLLSNERPIVIVLKKRRGKKSLSGQIAPDSRFLGLFLPYTPLHLLLLKLTKRPLVATSANISEEPIILEKDELFKKLPNVADFVVDHDREILNGCDDSVLRVADSKPIYLRLSRGYAPLSLKLPKPLKQCTLAVGAHQKNTVAFGIGDTAYISPHIGDLTGVGAVEYFERTIESLKRIWGFAPELIVCDKNSSYASSVYAANSKLPMLSVQHHRAHAWACMAENSLLGETLCAAWDGTGLGDDGSIWGGEFFLGDYKNLKRVYSFAPIRLLGGEQAAKEPRRSALAVLFRLFGKDVQTVNSLTTTAFSEAELKTLYTAFTKGLNSPLTSSVGRLFDAAASFIGLLQKSGYEGQSGLMIESLYNSKIKSRYEYELCGEEISLLPTFIELLHERDQSVAASKFINTLSAIVLHIAKQHECPTLLSGGVFQNSTLVSKIAKEFRSAKLPLYMHKKLPPNDASIAYGQLVAASFANI